MPIVTQFLIIPRNLRSLTHIDCFIPLSGRNIEQLCNPPPHVPTPASPSRHTSEVAVTAQLHIRNDEQYDYLAVMAMAASRTILSRP